MAAGLRTWLDSVAMVPSVVMGVAKEALLLGPPAPARLVDTVPVTVPSVVTPAVGSGRAHWEGSVGRTPVGGPPWHWRTPWEDPRGRTPWEDPCGRTPVALKDPMDLGGPRGRTLWHWEDPMDLGGPHGRTLWLWEDPMALRGPHGIGRTTGKPCGTGRTP